MISEGHTEIGVVVIGRNEGDRLRLCLESLARFSQAIVYVDSGSTDQSVAVARSLGINVVELDMTFPFTAARARNEGFRRLRSLADGARYVQFVDGDCVVVADWLEGASNFLDEHPEVAVVCGRRRERFPERSVYNKLCDIEWNTPVGEATACGGDAMMRVDVFETAGGYRDNLIAGEEPELCVRLRRLGWKIWRLDAEMTLHDAAMTKFSQWWRRSARGGHAFAEGAALHGGAPVRHWVRESRSAWLWGAGIPLLTALMLPVTGLWALGILLVYPLQVVRLAWRETLPPPVKWWRSFFLVVQKFPEVCGQLQYWRNRISRNTHSLIEYK